MSYEPEKFNNLFPTVIVKGVLCAAVIIGLSFGMKVYAGDTNPIKACDTETKALVQSYETVMLPDEILQALLDDVQYKGKSIKNCKMQSVIQGRGELAVFAYESKNFFHAMYWGRFAKRAIPVK